MASLHRIAAALLLAVAIFLPAASALNVVATQQPLLAAIAAVLTSSKGCFSTGWTTSCSQRKVCTPTGSVIQILLSDCGLSGPIPTAFSSLTTLSRLVLSQNTLTGAIPDSVAGLRSLTELDVSGNKLTTLPSALGSRVRKLILARNSFSGAFPSSYGTNALITIDISGNQFTSLPDMQLFRQLQELNASSNSLTTMPLFGDVNAGMNKLDLSSNAITGSLPTYFSSLSNALIVLKNNRLTGGLPSSLFSPYIFANIDLSNNYLSGFVPDDLCAGSQDVSSATLAGNCLSYRATFSCDLAEQQRMADDCQKECGSSCVPVFEGVDKTSAPPAGCKECSKQGVAYQLVDGQGVKYPADALQASARGAPSRNIQKYLTVGPTSGNAGIIKATQADSWVSCCDDCAKQEGCTFWHFYPPGNGPVPGGQGNKLCYLLSGDSAPLAMLPAVQLVDTSVPVSHVGGKCNALAAVVDDPHFVGARGTRFDFTGRLGGSFCLVSDARVHVNVLLQGYLDKRLEGATKVQDGKALRNWIKEFAVLWRSRSGVTSTVHLQATSGKLPESNAAAFLRSVQVDGKQLRLPQVGEEVRGAQGLRLVWRGVEWRGSHNVSTYELVLDDAATLQVRMRSAHPLLQTPSDSHVHFNIHFTSLEPTKAIHGILGQTFRSDGDRVSRALQFSQLAGIANSPVVADGESGKGFLDGSEDDYSTTSVTAPDCAFAHPAWRPLARVKSAAATATRAAASI